MKTEITNALRRGAPWFAAMAIVGVMMGQGTHAYAEERKDLLPMPELGEDGIYKQPWFLESFLDLREDLTEASESGKRLVIIWEQNGCPYCREMHRVNLRIPEVVDYIKANFTVMMLNLWGDREVTDLDGEVLSEKQFARKLGVQFTPTIQFLADEAPEGKGLRDAEVWRLPGYFKPFHFLNSFVYVREKGYEAEPNFQRWLQARAEKLREEGKDVSLW